MLIHELPQQPPLSIGGAENGHTMKLFNIMYFLQKNDIMLHFTLSESSDITGYQCLLSCLPSGHAVCKDCHPKLENLMEGNKHHAFLLRLEMSA